MPLKLNFHSQQLHIWMPRVASLLLVLLIAQSLALTSERFLMKNAGSEQNTENINNPAPPTKPNMAFHYAEIIAQTRPFGEVGKSTSNAPIVAPDTQLNLKLMGILSTGGTHGIAIIFGDNEEKFFKVGDVVPGNATLREVHPDKVILESSRGFETLRLPVERDANFMSDNPPAYIQPEAMEGNNIHNQLATYRDQFTSNPSSLIGLANIQEARTPEGTFMGFKISLRDEELAAQIGLEKEDVIVAVNNTKISQPSDGVQVLRQLRNAKRLDITIIRDGQELRIEHDINE